MGSRTYSDATEHDSGRHPVNTGHLVMGLAFAGLVAIWAVISNDVVADEDIRWLMPLPWVVAGAIGLGVSAWGGVRRRPVPPAAATPPAPSDPHHPTAYAPPAAAPPSGGGEPTPTPQTNPPHPEENP